MNFKSIALTASMLALSTSVNASLITFEEVGSVGITFNGEPPLNEQYLPLGVTFDGGWKILNEGAGFGIDALSGTNFAAFNTKAGSTQTIGMTFDSNISDISGFLGDGLSVEWTISAYLDNLLISDTTVTNLAGEYIEFSLASLTADYVTVSSLSKVGVMDDLSFTSAVPVPAAVWLFGSGLIGLIGIARRKI